MKPVNIKVRVRLNHRVRKCVSLLQFACKGQRRRHGTVYLGYILCTGHLTSKSVKMYNLTLFFSPTNRGHILMPMVEFNYAFVFSFYFAYAKLTETLAATLRARSWRYLRWWPLLQQGLQHNSYPLRPTSFPLPHRGWYPSYPLTPPAGMGYQDSAMTFYLSFILS